MHPDRIVDEYASRQYGTFSHQQVEEAGFSSRMILTRIENGAWLGLAPAVYVLASAPPKWERRMAAALLTRSGSIVAGRSASHLHAFDGFGPGRPVIMIGPGGGTPAHLSPGSSAANASIASGANACADSKSPTRQKPS